MNPTLNKMLSPEMLLIGTEGTMKSKIIGEKVHHMRGWSPCFKFRSSLLRFNPTNKFPQAQGNSIN